MSSTNEITYAAFVMFNDGNKTQFSNCHSVEILTRDGMKQFKITDIKDNVYLPLSKIVRIQSVSGPALINGKEIKCIDFIKE